MSGEGSLRYTDDAWLAHVRVDGRDCAYLDLGAQGAPAVLLLHGGGFDRAGLSWEKTIPALVPRFRVIAPDLPGYGASEGFGRPHDVAELGRWTVGFMDAVRVSRAHVAGVSMGAAMALWLAIRHPGRVDRLVPVGAYGLARRAPFHPLSWALTRLPLMRISYALAARSRRMARLGLAAAYADPAKITDDTVSDVMAISRQMARAPAFGYFQRAEVRPTRLKTWLMDDLHRIRAPTLVVHGRADRLVPLCHAEAAASRIPSARLTTLDCGHWPMREAPEAFNAVLLGFLEPDPAH